MSNYTAEERIKACSKIYKDFEKSNLDLTTGGKFALYLIATSHFEIRDNNYELLKEFFANEDLNNLDTPGHMATITNYVGDAIRNVIEAVKTGDNTKIEYVLTENKEVLLSEEMNKLVESVSKFLRGINYDDAVFAYNVVVGEKLNNVSKELNIVGEKLDNIANVLKDQNQPSTLSELTFDNAEITPVMKTVRMNSREYTWNQAYELMEKQLVPKANVGRAVLLRGVPGTGKTTMALEFVDRYNKKNNFKDNMKFISFNNNTTYNDFIYGTMAVNGKFVEQAGIFKELCDEALKHPEKMYFCVIDEFTRGNTATILGEALTGMERRNTPISLGQFRGKSLIVPNNICIIATMNSRDKSTINIDQALLDRFIVLDIEPMWMNMGCIDALASNLGEYNEENLKSLVDIMAKIDETLVKNGDDKFRIGTRAIQRCMDYTELKSAVRNRILPRLIDANNDREINSDLSDNIKALKQLVDNL